MFHYGIFSILASQASLQDTLIKLEFLRESDGDGSSVLVVITLVVVVVRSSCDM